VKHTIFSNAFNCDNVTALNLTGKGSTAIYRAAVNHNGASAALGFFAALLSSGETKIVTDKVKEGTVVLTNNLYRVTVKCKA
jgi:hypothetical protein